MFSALRVGLSGLRVNQQHLDIIGNNLTNAETSGFKSDRMTFADAFYQKFSSGSGPGASLGGTNGRQVGRGVGVGSIDHVFSQGNLINTGRTFDLALQGQGFFVLSDGNQQYFTRVGSFDTDRDGNLVDSRTGLKVVNSDGQSIKLDQGAFNPARATSLLSLGGNLPAEKLGPLTEIQTSNGTFDDDQPAVLTSSTLGGGTVDLSGKTLSIEIDGTDYTVNFDPGLGVQNLTDAVDAINAEVAALNLDDAPLFEVVAGEIRVTSANSGDGVSLQLAGDAAQEIGLLGQSAQGTSTTAVGTTLLNDLNANRVDYVAGDVIRINGIDSQGNSVQATFTYGAANDGTTLADLQAAIQNAFPGTSIELQGGSMVVTANESGENPLTITLADAPNNTGSSRFDLFGFDVTQEGTGPDTRATTIEIFDSLGIAHKITGTFIRQDDDSWNLELELDEESGTIAEGGVVTDITFNADGSLQGAVDLNLEIVFENGAATQQIEIDLGEAGQYEGLTLTGAPTSAQFEIQDGHPAGKLVGFEVGTDGVIRGEFSNGQRIDLETLAIARFQNEAGLVKESSTLFSQGDNSGSPVLGKAQEDGRAAVFSRSLEGSNVDTSEEFVRLITAQRTFQSSARIVTTADEMLVELLQVI